jgi:hypothetical protein
MELGQELLIHGWQMGGAPGVLANPWLCTLQLARRHFHFGRNNLGHIAAHLGVRMGRAHRALNDVYMTAEILKRMVRTLEQRRLTTVGDLLHAQGAPIYAPAIVPQLPDVVAAALRNGRNLRILYLGQNGESNREITPLYPCQHRNVVYLVASLPSGTRAAHVPPGPHFFGRTVVAVTTTSHVSQFGQK